MKLGLLEALFLLGALGILFIRLFFRWATRGAGPVAKSRHTTLDTFALIAAMAFMMPIPLVYFFSPLLDFATFHLPMVWRWLGVPFLAASVGLFWRSHADLGGNWSGYPEIKQQHDLITGGIYGWIRHPMYASVLVWSFGQAVVLTNWIAGAGSLVAGLLFIMVRAPQEDAMLRAHFGTSYDAYAKRTGGLFPRF